MFISVIIPIYNEKKVLVKNINKIYNFFSGKYDFEIVAIDDASTDNSKALLQSIQYKNLLILKNEINLGKGYSIIKGIKACSGNIILLTDADLSSPIIEIEKLLQEYNKGYDIVMGSRNMENSIINIKQNFLRICVGKIFNFLVRVILGLKYHDTQCGFKLFNSKKMNEILKSLNVNRFCIDVEILFLAKKLNFKVSEVGIKWDHNNNSSVNILSDSINMFFDLIKIRFRNYKK